MICQRFGMVLLLNCGVPLCLQAAKYQRLSVQGSVLCPCVVAYANWRIEVSEMEHDVVLKLKRCRASTSLINSGGKTAKAAEESPVWNISGHPTARIPRNALAFSVSRKFDPSA